MAIITDTALAPKIKAASETLDAWTREMVEWHFNPETGCPFWLDFAAKLDWDPRQEIRAYNDLDRFGFFQDEWLRGGPVRRWVPKAYAEPARLRLRNRRQHRRTEIAHLASTISASTMRPSAPPCPMSLFRPAPTG